MELKELEKLVETVYTVVGEKYLDDFKYIIGGCHCTPATEWYGDVCMAFKKVINDDVVNNAQIKEQIVSVVEQLSKWFTQ